MQILRKSSFRAVPWRNGGGITHEIIRQPPDGEFCWRLSVAQIDQSGPFSNFAGYTRTMVLLRGPGVRLTFPDRPPVELARVGSTIDFDGAAAPQCELVAGPCADLNLMVSASLPGTATRVERLSASRLLNPVKGMAVVFVISGTLRVETDRVVCPDLSPWDLIITDARSPACLLAPLGGDFDPPLVFCAELNDNSA